MLTLSQVLQLAAMKKGDFDARRARGLLDFLPLAMGGYIPDNADPRPSARARYTLADAFALDLFQQAATRRLPNDLVDAMIGNAAGQLDHALARPGPADLFLGCALVGEARAPGDDDGRAHAMIGTMQELLPWIERRATSGLPDDSDAFSHLVLLNLSAARRRVMQRLRVMFPMVPA